MYLEEIKELFEKLELYPTLDSIGLILPYTDNQLITRAFNIVYNEKYQKCIDEFEGINEYDTICQVLNFDMSELKRKIDLFSKNELIFMQTIIDNALNKINRNEIIAKIIPALEEYKAINTSKLIDETKIENFFNKFDLNNLYALNVILDNNHEPDSEKYKNIFNKVLKEKEKKKEARYYNLLDLLNKMENLNDEEFVLFYELVENASLYLASVQENLDVYNNVIEDFNIDEYPINAIYKLQEKLLEKIERKKKLCYTKNNISL